MSLPIQADDDDRARRLSQILRDARLITGEIVSSSQGGSSNGTVTSYDARDAHRIARELSGLLSQQETTVPANKSLLTLHRLVRYVVKKSSSRDLSGLIEDLKWKDSELAACLRGRYLTELLQLALQQDDREDRVDEIAHWAGHGRVLVACLDLLTDPKSAAFASDILSRCILHKEGLQAFLGLCAQEREQEAETNLKWLKLLLTVPKAMSKEAYFSTLVPLLFSFLDGLHQNEEEVATMVLSALLARHPTPMTRHISKPLQKPFVEGLVSDSAAGIRLEIFARCCPDRTQVMRTISPLLPDLYSIFSLSTPAQPSDPMLEQLTREEVHHSVLVLGAEIKASVEASISSYFKKLPEEEAEMECIRLLHLTFRDDRQAWEVLADGSVRRGDARTGWPNTALVQLLKILELKNVVCAVFLAAFEEYTLTQDPSGSVDVERDLKLSRMVLLLIYHFQTELISTPQEMVSLLDKVLAKACDLKEEPEQTSSAPDWLTTSLTLLEAVIAERRQALDIAASRRATLAASLKTLSTHSSAEVALKAKGIAILLASIPMDSGETVAVQERALRSDAEKALEMLKDDVVPVRAQAITILRDLILKSQRKVLTDVLACRILAALQIALNDEDSFVYLRVIQAFAAISERYGDEVLTRLTSAYSSSRLDLSQLDFGLRLGESILQIIQRAGETIYKHLHRLIPPLSHVLRDHESSFILRASALSLLGESVTMAPLAMISHMAEVLDAAITILELERGLIAVRTKANDEENPYGFDEQHVLRRAAALCIYQIARGLALKSALCSDWPMGTIGRTLRVLKWTRDTDTDDLVRWQASAAFNEINANVTDEASRADAAPLIQEVDHLHLRRDVMSATSARILPKQHSLGPKAVAVPTDQGVLDSSMYAWGWVLVSASYLLFTLGLYAVLGRDFGPDSRALRDSVLEHMAIDRLEYFACLGPLLLPVGFWCLLVSWVGMKIFRHV